MVTESRENIVSRSVDNLKALFTVVIALALTQSVKSLVVINQEGLTDVNVHTIPIFLSLLITIIPFHQGASRYLDETYITEGSEIKRLDGLIDFFFFMLEAILFYLMALSMNKPQFFFDVLVVLFAFDVLWLIYVRSNKDKKFDNIKNWLFINIPVLLILFVFNHGTFMNNDIYKWISMSMLLLVRTIVDYSFSWDFYWGLGSEKKSA